mgnify:FL=1
MRDNVHPGEKWEFNGEVAACFANMLERSIPDYRSMRALTYKLGERFIQPETLIVDVGCSTGLAVEPFVAKYGQSNNFLLVDNAPAMVEACQKRFRADVNVTVRQGNIWEYLPFEQKSSLVLSVLSMQFMPTSYRPRMLKQIYDGLTDGGALERASRFHKTIPGYAPTPLVSLDHLAQKLGVAQVLVKDESRRFGLNAFKALGGSYAMARCLGQRLGLAGGEDYL